MIFNFDAPSAKNMVNHEKAGNMEESGYRQAHEDRMEGQNLFPRSVPNLV